MFLIFLIVIMQKLKIDKEIKMQKHLRIILERPLASPVIFYVEN